MNAHKAPIYCEVKEFIEVIEFKADSPAYSRQGIRL